jgi:hypothetical protein
MFGRMKDPAQGTATVVTYDAFTAPGIANDTRPGLQVTLQAQVVVQAHGLEPTAVELITNFPQSELPLQPNTVLPVTVDRKNPNRVKLDPNFAKQAKTAAKQAVQDTSRAAHDQAEDVAASMRAKASPGRDGPPASAV